MAGEDQDDPNAAQAELWDGAEGEHWARYQDCYDKMLHSLGERVLDAAGLAPANHVLDVGCGCGDLSISAARRAARGEVLGIDLSEPMLARARRRAAEEGVENVRFEQGDAQVHRFAHTFDTVVSRFGVMFFADPVAAFGNLARALRRGGRLAFVCWQDVFANEWMFVPGAAVAMHLGIPEGTDPRSPGPFAFGDRQYVHAVLESAGFEGVECQPVQTSLLIGGGMNVDESLAFLRDTGMGRMMFERADPDSAARALEAVREAVEPYVTPEGVRLAGAAWLVTAHRP